MGLLGFWYKGSISFCNGSRNGEDVVSKNWSLEEIYEICIPEGVFGIKNDFQNIIYRIVEF